MVHTLISAAILTTSLAACTNFPCSPQNPCAPGDGGAGLRNAAAAWQRYGEPPPPPAPVYAAAPQFPVQRQPVTCQWFGPRFVCQ